MKKLNEKKYAEAVKTIAESLVIMAYEDEDDDNDFEDVLEDYTGDFYDQLEAAVRTSIEKML